MPHANITKRILADSLKQLMAKEAFSKICVSDIVENCGFTRQAFYYHFKDKYDLMNWIYYTETASFMSHYDMANHWTDGLKDLCYYMQENKSFYINALNTTGQNSFQEYLYGYLRDIAMAVIESKGRSFEEKWEFTAEFMATTIVGLLVHWANDGMEEDPAKYIAHIRSIFDGTMLHELEGKENHES